MRWAKQSEYWAVSNSQPAYRIARFIVDGKPLFRASVRGEFIGKVCPNPKEAQAICERHLMIMGEEKDSA